MLWHKMPSSVPEIQAILCLQPADITRYGLGVLFIKLNGSLNQTGMEIGM